MLVTRNLISSSFKIGRNKLSAFIALILSFVKTECLLLKLNVFIISITYSSQLNEMEEIMF